MGFESNLNHNAVPKKEAAQKTKRGIFSPLICGEAGGGGGGYKFCKVEALRGALWPTLGRGGKRIGRRACNYVESLEFELPLQ